LMAQWTFVGVLGAGMMKYADGSVYEGEWQDDVQNGRGETVH
jgi:hypothetical protein